MSKPSLQILLKWSEEHEGKTYWYTIRRGADGNGYYCEGFFTEDTFKNVTPQFSMPINQDDIAAEFTKQGKEWKHETSEA